MMPINEVSLRKIINTTLRNAGERRLAPDIDVFQMAINIEGIMRNSLRFDSFIRSDGISVSILMKKVEGN